MLLNDYKKKAVWNYGRLNKKTLLKAILSDGSLAMALYRLMNLLNSFMLTKILSAFVCKVNTFACGATIGRGAKFGRGLVILHSVGIVINSKVIAGDDIVLESGVVIGEEKRHCPVLGSNIFIGSGAKIFGGISIGNNVSIGANSIVNKDVIDDVVVAGVPAKIVKYKNK